MKSVVKRTMKAGPRRSLYKLKRLLKANKYRTDLTKVCNVMSVCNLCCYNHDIFWLSVGPTRDHIHKKRVVGIHIIRVSTCYVFDQDAIHPCMAPQPHLGHRLPQKAPLFFSVPTFSPPSLIFLGSVMNAYG